MQRNRKSSGSLGIITLVLALALWGGAAQAQNSFWTNTSSSTFTDAGSWSNGVPGLTTNAVYAVPGATYTVTWTSTITNTIATISNNNQNITWDLGGFTNILQTPYPGTALFMSPSAGETNNLTIMNGYLSTPAGTAGFLSMVGPGSTITVTNGGKVVMNLSAGGFTSAGGTITVTGSGSYFGAGDVAQARTLIVRDGAAATMRNGTDINFLTVDNATLTNMTPFLSWAGDRFDLINGGKMTSGFQLIGFGAHSSGASATGNVGRATDSATSMLEANTGLALYRFSQSHGTDVYLNINSNGVVRIGQAVGAVGAGTVVYTNAALWGRSDFFVDDMSVVTLNNGRIEMNSTNASQANYMDLANEAKILGYLPSNNPGLLRGTGQIIKTNAGVNFQIRNDGWIKPGDTNGTPALGVLSIVRGDLLQTNALATNAGLYFGFSDTALDQINISGGSARILSGSNVFALAAGSSTPTPGVKWGLGVYDFIIATNLTYTPNYDNLSNLLSGTYGLTFGTDYRYGPLDLGNGMSVLRLEFVPEPSTVLLLVGGGLVLFRLRGRFGGQGRFRRGRGAGKMLLIGFAALGLCVGNMRASTNSWIDPGAGYSGNWTDGTHWDVGVPTSADKVLFTNAQSSAYTVTFTGNATDGTAEILNDKVIFDLAGFAWTNTVYGFVPYAVNTTYRIGSNAAPVEVTFTSTGSPGSVHFGSYYPYYGDIRNATITITNAKVNVGAETGIANSTINVRGSNAWFLTGNQTTYDWLGGVLNVVDGGKATLGSGISALSGPDTVVTISNGSTLQNGGAVGWFYAGTVNLLTNSTWYAGGLRVGELRVYTAAPWMGTVVVDTSTVYATTVEVGNGAGNTGRLTIQNGSTMVVSNGWMLVGVGNNGGAATNLFVLNNGTIVMGRSGFDGALTNRSIMKAGGTIRGNGTGKLLVRNEGRLEVGNSIGTLVLSNANLELAAGSLNLFEFSSTGFDQIQVYDGSASVLGTNLYTLTGSTAGLTNGVKWGIGVYDFIVGSNVVWNPQWDNLTNVLAGYGLVQNTDFRFGLADLGGGLQALRLEFVPEPSTVLLLVGGGLLLWRARRRT